MVHACDHALVVQDSLELKESLYNFLDLDGVPTAQAQSFWTRFTFVYKHDVQ
jgi:hypothetical protein